MRQRSLVGAACQEASPTVRKTERQKSSETSSSASTNLFARVDEIQRKLRRLLLTVVDGGVSHKRLKSVRTARHDDKRAVQVVSGHKSLPKSDADS